MLAAVVAETSTTSPGNRSADGRMARAADARAKAKTETRDIFLLLQKPKFLTDRQILEHVGRPLSGSHRSAERNGTTFDGRGVNEISVGSELS
jgi:hypothetical protein